MLKLYNHGLPVEMMIQSHGINWQFGSDPDAAPVYIEPRRIPIYAGPPAPLPASKWTHEEWETGLIQGLLDRMSCLP